MPQKRRSGGGGGGRRNNYAHSGPRASTPVEAPPPREKKAPVHYGKPVILLEDSAKNTFAFANGAWVQQEAKIAQLQLDCQVKALPQKVNGMIRYEIRYPLPAVED
jgi:hypothetical protein